MLNFYKKLGFDLVPIIRNGKIPIEKDWTNKSHKDIGEWNNWLKTGINIGVLKDPWLVLTIPVLNFLFSFVILNSNFLFMVKSGFFI